MSLVPTCGLDLDVYARRQAQLVERLDRLGGRLHDVDQPLVGADLELLAGLFIDVGARQYRVTLDASWQGNRTMHDGPSTLRRIDDFHRALIQDGVIVRLHADPDNFGRMSGHGCSPKVRFPDCQTTIAPRSNRPATGCQ